MFQGILGEIAMGIYDDIIYPVLVSQEFIEEFPVGIVETPGGYKFQASWERLVKKMAVAFYEFDISLTSPWAAQRAAATPFIVGPEFDSGYGMAGQLAYMILFNV
jgi:hypothetical protein